MAEPEAPRLKTVDRMCRGCIHGRTPDLSTYDRARTLSRMEGDVIIREDGSQGPLLLPRDTHACHRWAETRKERGDEHGHVVCRGFLENHRLGKSVGPCVPVEGLADEVDALWGAPHEAIE